jgi:hypothetical protein
MSKGIAPITSTNDINAIVRQVNQNFQILANRSVSGSTITTGNSAVSVPGSVTDSSQFAIYYDASGLPRVAIGTTTSTGEEVIAISNEGVNVINALRRNPINSGDFYFNSSLVMTSLGNLASKMTVTETNIATLENKMTVAETNITDLTDRVATLEDKMAAAEDELADHEARIEALENPTP